MMMMEYLQLRDMLARKWVESVAGTGPFAFSVNNCFVHIGEVLLRCFAAALLRCGSAI